MPPSAGARLFETHVPHTDVGMRNEPAIGKRCTPENISKLLFPRTTSPMQRCTTGLASVNPLLIVPYPLLHSSLLLVIV